MYRFELGSVPVSCDTVEELHAAVGFVEPKTAMAAPAAKRRTAKKTPGSAQKAAWAKARALADERDIPVREARSLIAAGKA